MRTNMITRQDIEDNKFVFMYNNIRNGQNDNIYHYRTKNKLYSFIHNTDISDKYSNVFIMQRGLFNEPGPLLFSGIINDRDTLDQIIKIYIKD